MPHLSYWQGEVTGVMGNGNGVILDKSYELAKKVKTVNHVRGVDLHEFRVLTNNHGPVTALFTIYQPIRYNWTDPESTTREIWIITCIFQEVEIETGKLVFEWSSIDHIDPSVSTVPINSSEVSGNGLTNNTGWDYL